MAPTTGDSRRSSTLVASGILLSRMSGFVRQRAIGHFFGLSGLADAFTAAFRIPNLMQNLLGEGVLSASFIPVYARLLEEGRDEEAGRVAGAIAGLLAIAAGIITLLAVVFADPLTGLLAPGYTGARRALTVDLVRIITPGIGFLVLSAWCLGILNSHRRFFLSYVAPVVWNLIQIVVLVAGGFLLLDSPGTPSLADRSVLEQLARALGWGTLVGGVAQLLIQLPAVLRLEPHLRASLDVRRDSVKRVLRAFVPVVGGRGVVQLSAYLDLLLASLLAAGAVTALAFAQQLYLLPVSLFGMSVAAAELPEMSRTGDRDVTVLDRRLDDGLARIGFYVTAATVVFLVVGDFLVGALFRSGSFGRSDEILVWLILIGFSIGLLATTSSRLLQSLLYATEDPRTPAKTAALRVAVSAAIGVLIMFQLDRFGLPDGQIRQLGDLPAFGPLPPELRDVGDAGERTLRLGAMGLTIGAGVGAWVEYLLLRSALVRNLGVQVRLGGSQRGRMIVPAVAAAATGLLGRVLLDQLPRWIGGSLTVVLVGLVYVLVATRTGVDEAHTLARQVRRRLPSG